MLLIYAPQLTPRLRYTFKVVLQNWCGWRIRFTNAREEFEQCDEAKLAYVPATAASSGDWKAHNLLFEEGLDKEYYETNQSFKSLFPGGIEASQSVDWFAAIFFNISRYEEWVNPHRDEYGRYEPHESILYKQGLLNRPIVDEWVIAIQNYLIGLYPKLAATVFKRKYQAAFSIDVDRPFLYKGRGLINRGAVLGKAMLEGRWKDIQEHLNVWFKRAKDPYDHFDAMIYHASLEGYSPIYFFHVGSYEEPDKNVRPDYSVYGRMIRLVPEAAWHASVRSMQDTSAGEKELSRLRKWRREGITRVRQHFLVNDLVNRPRHLESLGITADYSMGYAQQNGFRAGTGYAFPHYDFLTETALSIVHVPFAIMESAYQSYLPYQAMEMWAQWEQIIENTKAANGRLEIAFHWHSLSDHGPYEGWRAIYKKLVEKSI